MIETKRMEKPTDGSAMDSNPGRAKVVEYLRIHPGHAFCDECLARKLGIGLEAARQARADLAGARDLDQETWFCSACLSVKPVLHVAWIGSRS